MQWDNLKERFGSRTEHDSEILAWLLLAPIGLCYTLRKNLGSVWWGSTTNKVYVLGSTISWALLIWAQEISVAAYLISNFSILFVFVHTVGIYEDYAPNERRVKSDHDIEMYLLHVAAVVAITLVVIKFGRETACAVATALHVDTKTCVKYSGHAHWAAIAVLVTTLVYMQAKGFFQSSLIKPKNLFSDVSKYFGNGGFVYMFYLVVLFLIGLSW